MAKLAPWVSRILVIVIGYVAAIIALRFVPVQDTHASSITPGPSVEVPAVAVAPSVIEIANDAANQNIFGKPGSEPKPVIKREQGPPPVTRLNLKLVGVYTAEPADRALAIISSDGKPEEVFRVGETITGRAVLAEVKQNEVVIDNAGRKETVKLPELVASSGSNPGLENLPQGGPSNQAGGSQAGEPIQLPDSPKEIRDTLVSNPAMLNKLVSAVPYRENGRILGYKITPKQQDGLLANYGVLPGDVITRVNGIALANQKNAIRALRKLVKAPSIDLSILRDGAELPVSITLE